MSLDDRYIRRHSRASKPRYQKSLVLEVLEDRCLLSLMHVKPNVDIGPLTGNQSQGTIAIDPTVDPTKPSHLFAAGNRTDSGGLFTAYSTDSGATWTPSDLTAIPAASGDARAAFDQFGNLFLSYLTADSRVVVAWSTNGGQTFTASATLSAAAADRPALATGPGGTVAKGSIWVAFQDAAGNIAAAGAPVTGLGTVGAFGSAQEVPSSAAGNFSSLAVGPSGQVLVTYESPSTGAAPSTIFVSLNAAGLGAGEFANPTPATTTNVGGQYMIPAQPTVGIDAEPILAYDRSGGVDNGRVYLVYTDAPSAGSTNTNIFERRSDNNGVTWSDPVQVNDDTMGTASHFDPALAVDQTTGSIAVTWLDTRNDPANIATQVFGTWTCPGGYNFATNVPISDPTESSNAATAGNSIDFGRYMGLDFVNGAYYPIWADNSSALPGNPNPPGLNLATARVDVNPFPLTNEHTDLTYNYGNGAWTLGAENKDTFPYTDYTPDGVILVGLPGAKTTRASGSQWDFQGTAAGSTIWILPQTQNISLLYLGENAERTPIGTFATYFASDPRIMDTAAWINVNLISVRGPGQFSVWQTSEFGVPRVWMSTADSTVASKLFIVEQSHVHYSWGFTAPGLYEVNVQSSAYLSYPDMQTASPVTTYYFCVEDVPSAGGGAAAPVPASHPSGQGNTVVQIAWQAATFARLSSAASDGGEATVPQVFVPGTDESVRVAPLPQDVALVDRFFGAADFRDYPSNLVTINRTAHAPNAIGGISAFQTDSLAADVASASLLRAE
jgi:surface-anchored protein